MSTNFIMWTMFQHYLCRSLDKSFLHYMTRFSNILFLIRFYSMRAEKPLGGIELQEKEENNEKNVCLERGQRK